MRIEPRARALRQRPIKRLPPEETSRQIKSSSVSPDSRYPEIPETATRIPVFQHSAKLPAAIWWSHLERIFLAFDDLGCEELLA